MTLTHTPARPAVADLVARGNHALWTAGDLRSARTWFELAWTRAVAQDDPASAAAAALGLGGLWVHEHREDADRARVLSRQERAARHPDVPAGLALALRARVAAELDYVDGTHDRVLETLEEARCADDPEVLAQVLSLAHHCLLGPQHTELRTRLARELLLTAGRTTRPGDMLAGMLWLTVDQYLAGDPHAGRTRARLRRALAQNDHQAYGYAAAAVEVMLAIRAGDLDRAETMAADCAARGERCGDADAAGWYRGQIVTIRWFQGRLGELLPALREEVDNTALGEQDDSLLAALAVSAVAAGDDLVAAGAIARLGGTGLAGTPASSAWLVTVNGAAEAANRLGDASFAATLYRLLEPYGHLPVTGSLAMTCFGSARHALGLAALTTGEHRAGIAHLRRAVEHNLALGHWPAHCLSQQRLGQALLEHGDPDERHEGTRLLAGADREAERLGMVLPGRPAVPETPPAIRITLLGPVGIVVDGTVRPVPGARRRTVLGVLALNAGHLVSADRLIDIVWGDDAPRTAANTLQSHVSFLRRALGPGAPILGRSHGYQLDLPPDAVDAGRAERLVRAGEERPPQVAPLREALALWRGNALPDVENHPWLDGQAQQLDRLRLRAVKGLARAHLLAGQPGPAGELLTEAVREHPLDEQLHADLMRALHRQGMPGQALRVFERLRTALRDELGTRPGGPLRELHTAILREDPVP
ncbi:AfsR/SARP family transcriptional regulator [Kineosporia succinea]|uniref:DNA-binding SARP family transcriptional activator n=1 Tax=Kineosporia succinea TaxID=84632 RepID=A0ABT9PCT3_9ACTN|nr:AfsR/SARP family transcriptional regulator [Kineosporia succinea]MDP9830514.1 DNA-binding SARP family transcriptional activator [Kineosporia succinea]